MLRAFAVGMNYTIDRSMVKLRMLPFHDAKGPSTMQSWLSMENRGELGAHWLLKMAKGIPCHERLPSTTSAPARQQEAGDIATANAVDVANTGI